MAGGEGPKKFDVSKYPIPPGILPQTWAHLELRPRYIKEYPFEIEVAAVPCSGNCSRGNKRNHVFYLELLTPVWTEAKENGFDWGEWQFSSRRILGWTPIDQLQKTYEVDGQVFNVELGGSHDLCPQCQH